MKSSKSFVILTLLHFLSYTSYGQTFSQSFGGEQADEGRDVCVTHDQAIIVAGETQSFDAEGVDIYVVKFDTEGDTLWSTYIGRDTTYLESFHTEKSVAVIENAENEIIVCGTYHIVGWSDFHGTIMHRLSADGDLLQSKLYDVMAADDMVEMDNGGYMISGTGFSGFALPQAHVMMVDRDFNMLWGTQYTGSNGEASGLKGICRMNENEYVVVGYAYGYELSLGLMSGFDTLGNIIWSKEFITDVFEDNILFCVDKFDENTVVIGGVAGNFGHSKHATVWKVQTNGEKDWVYRGMGGPGRSEFEDIMVTDDGNIAACGRYDTTYWSDEISGVFMLFDEEGTTLRSKIWHDTAKVEFSGMALLNDAYYLTGPRTSVDGLNTDAILAKNYFYNPDTLCDLENYESGFLDPTYQVYIEYEPVFPVYGTNQESYIVRTGSGANISEICAHDEVYGAGISKHFIKNKINIYPNPFTENFTIASEKPLIQVKVFDLNGRLIASQFNNNQIIFNETIASGIYVVEVEQEGGDVSIQKVVKN